MSLLVGLTGGMGSGKTRAAALFKDLGARVIDADIICRKLVAPDQPAWHEIVEHFGQDIINTDRTVDRARLGKIVFENPKERHKLESILHPRVFEEEAGIYQKIQLSDPHAVVIIDAALLIESGNHEKVDKVIVISCDFETQINRILEKSSLTREEIVKRLASQMSLKEKIKYADYVLENNSTPEALEEGVRFLYKQLKSLA